MPAMLYVVLGAMIKHSPASVENVCKKNETFSDDSTRVCVHLINKHNDTKYPTDVSFVLRFSVYVYKNTHETFWYT